MLQKLFRTKNIDKLVADASHDDAHGGGLKRVLSLKDLTFFGIAAIIGAGSFSSLGEAIFKGGPGVIVLFIICGIACGFTAMCYAEFASRIPVAGSAYTYAYASFGELFAWIIGWALIMEYSIGNIYVAYSWSDYFTSFLERLNVHLPDYLTSSYMEVKKAIASGSTKATYLNAWNHAPNFLGIKFIVDLPAFIINILITYLVYIGVKESKNFSNAMVILKLAIVILVILMGIQYINTANWLPANSDGVKSFMPNGFGGVMSAVSAVFFAYIGFDAISVMGEEAKNPQRDLPRSMILSLIICTVVYILLTLVLTGGVHYAEYEGVGDPLAEVFKMNGDKWMQFLVSICAIIAITSVLLVFQLGQPRIWMSMSRDGLMPPKFQSIHKKYQTPQFATIMTGLVVGIPLLFTDRSFILDFTSIGTLFAFVLVCGGVLLLPRKEKTPGRFSIPYINAQWLFPLIVMAAIGLITSFNKSYFPNLFELNLNKNERIDATTSFVNNKSESLTNKLITSGTYRTLFYDKQLQKNDVAKSINKQIETNTQINNWINNSITDNVVKNDKIQTFLNQNMAPESSSIYKEINNNFIIRKISDSINNNKGKLYFASDDEIAQLKRYKEWDTTDNTLIDKQQMMNRIIRDSVQMDQLESFVFSNEVRNGLNKITYDDLRANLAEKDLVKKTANLSLIVFWLTCIALAIFAFIKKWSLIPILGLVSCLYLLTGMGASNWKWFAVWFAIGLTLYFLYGYKKSKLNYSK